MGDGDRERWNDKWAAGGGGTSHDSQVVNLVTPWLPTTGRLLDVAGGGSIASLELARRGLDVTVCDVSDVGLAQARQRALAEELTITTIELDLEADPLPVGPWDVITVANYLQRNLFTALASEIALGGIIGVVIATVTNLDRNPKPGRSFLVERDELPGLIAAEGLEILHHSEDWRRNGRHEAHLVARA